MLLTLHTSASRKIRLPRIPLHFYSWTSILYLKHWNVPPSRMTTTLSKRYIIFQELSKFLSINSQRSQAQKIKETPFKWNQRRQINSPKGEHTSDEIEAMRDKQIKPRENIDSEVGPVFSEKKNPLDEIIYELEE